MIDPEPMNREVSWTERWRVSCAGQPSLSVGLCRASFSTRRPSTVSLPKEGVPHDMVPQK